ncbi:MAG: hypothetical protein IPL69_19430 [Saprospiraceae bacterium]|nr:hypothetical protein [Candidatus Brachybacter algidus]
MVFVIPYLGVLAERNNAPYLPGHAQLHQDNHGLSFWRQDAMVNIVFAPLPDIFLTGTATPALRKSTDFQSAQFITPQCVMK